MIYISSQLNKLLINLSLCWNCVNRAYSFNKSGNLFSPKLSWSIIRIKSIKLIILYALLLAFFVHSALSDFVIFENNKPSCIIIIPENPLEQELFATNELNYFIEKLTGIILDTKLDSDDIQENNLILIGTYETNRYIRELYDRGLLINRKELSEEESIVRILSDRGRNLLVISGNNGRCVIYSVYEVVEKMIESVTGFKVNDLDFNINRAESLVLGDLNIRSKPFYPFRCALSYEDSTWLSRHRLNVSGAEGIWSGTGIDDGLGTAFKYVFDSEFDNMQDDTFQQRWARVWNLRSRLWKLSERGVESYLFMYVMGEPTKAIIAKHPELLEDEVKYGASRNGESYRPISWTKPEARKIIKNLVKSIVATYSPYLTGFHLRAWGWETRAPNGDNAKMQKELWSIYFDIIDSAREVNPNFKFIVSGYDSVWLKDSDRSYISKLPVGTVIIQKWGVDGEPTNDPEIKADYINAIGKNGQRIAILSHDVEEVMPLWMIEADLFAEGLRKYANMQNLKGLSGFTIQGETGFARLDRIVSSHLNYDPNEDYVALMKNYLSSHYGTLSSGDILSSLRKNTKVLSSYFSDYAGTLSITGKYGNGSRGYATRFWNLIGKDAVKDTLSIRDIKDIKYAKERLSSLLPIQQESANQISQTKKKIYASSEQAEFDFLDAMHLMRMWVRFFESRLRLIDALEAGAKGATTEAVQQKIISAIEYSKEIYGEISEIKSFVNVFGYKNDTARDSLLKLLNEEMDFLKSFDPKGIISISNQYDDSEQETFSLKSLIVHPNPASNGADFCYILGSYVDEVTINIYSISGRKVKTISEASPKKGYNEEIWDTRDDEGNKVANGTYLFKIVAKKDDNKIEKIGKISVIR